jgi:hypothetical protein
MVCEKGCDKGRTSVSEPIMLARASLIECALAREYV